MKVWAWLGGLLVAATMAPAGAAETESVPAVSAPSLAADVPTPAPAPSPKRAVPDYDGRGERSATPGDAALVVPRVLLSPIYLVTEWVIRRPLGAAISAAERAGLPRTLYDFFTFGPDHKAGIVPIGFVDFGFNPSVGVYGFWDDALAKGNDLQAHVSFWPDDWLGASLADRYRFRGGESVQVKVLAVRRPDHVFFGIGPTTLESARSRYREDLLDGVVSMDVPMWRASKLDVELGLRAVSFGEGAYGGDPGILQSVAAGVFPLPDGFARGYTAEHNDALVAFDSRRPFPADGSGVRLEAQAEQGNDLRQSPASGWLRYAAGAGAFWDVNGKRRVLSLSANALFSDPLGSRPPPFTELVSLGGDIASPGAFPAPMPGFFPGRLVDRSAAVATARYKWPIGPWLSGSLQAAVGNVFGEHLSGFDPKLLRFSGSVGLESDSSADSSFELLIGIGSETFEHGGQIDSFRLAVGITRF